VRALRLLLTVLSYGRARLGVWFWTGLAYARLRAHGAAVGPGLSVRGPIRLHCHRTGSIRIGGHCRMQSGFAGNAVGGDGRMGLWVGPGAQLSIGDHVGLSNATIVCQRAVRIGDHALVGGGVRIYDTDFHSLDHEQRRRPGNPGARTAPVAIGRHAFVGGHAIILKGTIIGERSVIGAGSVVRAEVPAGQIWTGNPARFTRELRAVARLEEAL
jgi:acetyltransferase-like isoleucine patch superfamily enzyme